MRIIILLLLILPCAGICQTKEFHFNKLSIKDGLQEDLITAMFQDKRGYMWFGTQGGLVRYDGYKIKVYKFGVDDPNRCSVSFIFEDRTGDLWVGTVYEELYRYNVNTDTFLPFYRNPAKNFQTLPGYSIASVYDDRAGDLWFVASDVNSDASHLSRFNVKNRELKRFDNTGKGDNYINASGFTTISEDNKGRMWVGSTNGIYEYVAASGKFISHFATDIITQQKKLALKPDPQQPGAFWLNVWDTHTVTGEGLWRYNTNDNSLIKYRHIAGDPNSLATDSILRLYKDAHDRLWFTTFDGMILYDAPTGHFITYNQTDKKTNPYTNIVTDLTEDKEGNFWFANQVTISFFDVKTKKITKYKAGDSNSEEVPYSSVLNLFIDRSGTLWAGTAFQGVYWVNYSRSLFSVYKKDPGEPHNFPGGGSTSFAEDKDGTCWVWSATGLYHWYPAIDSFAPVPSMKNHGERFSWHFSSVVIDKRGTIWCNSFGKGIASYNPATGNTRHYINNAKDSSSISNDYVSALFVDKKGSLWAGTFGSGLCRYNENANSFRRYPFATDRLSIQNNPSLNDAVVYSIMEDKEGNLWVGTNFGGVNKFDPLTETFSPFQNQLPGFTTISMSLEDSKGRLWVGTHEGGLYLCDRKTNTAKRYTEADGLIYDGSLGMTEDNEGNIWFASQRGFSILNNKTNTFSHLGIVNGLPESPENNLNLFKASDGRLVLPCNDGFISFYPSQLKPDTTAPVINIESVEITNPRTWGAKQTDSVIYGNTNNEIHLKYNENRIAFNYVGIQFQNSALNQYAYKLDGYDKDWVQAGTTRKATYTNLSANEYVFHVKAANSDGIWGATQSVITIIISPPWWRTWWAYALYVIVFAAVVFGFIAYRSRRLIRENLVLEEKVVDRTRRLNKSLDNLKATQAQLIQSEKMASLGELTAGIAHEIQNPLNFVNNFSDVNTELIEELKSEWAKDNGEKQPGLTESLLNDIKANEEKINHHGKRADAIVKGMLQHSQRHSGVEESTDINALADEYLRFACNSFRRRDSGFHVNVKTDFDENTGNINIVNRDMGRVLLNVYNNAFYETNEKSKLLKGKYEPVVIVSTKAVKPSPGGGDLGVLITVRDNGNGISQKIIDKIFQPFFTTKPAGQGTGLGLSLAYDIIKAHGGEIKVNSVEGEFTEFVIQLPVTV